MNTPVSRIDLAQTQREPDSNPGRLIVNGARFHIGASPGFQNAAMNAGWLPAGKGEPAIGVSAPVEASSVTPLTVAAPSWVT